jgi:hypothetical protein
MATPKIPFEIYVLDATSKLSTPVPLASLIKSGISLDPITGQMIVVPAGTEILGFENDAANGIVLDYKDKDGVERQLTAEVITGNALAFDPVAKTMTATVNGVESNVLDVSALVADINVDTVAWNQTTFVLTLTETSPDGGVTPGTVHTLDLSSLVAVSVQDSVAGNGTVASPLKLVNDLTAPGNWRYYGTNNAGVRGWYGLPTQLVISSVAVTEATNSDIPLAGFGDSAKQLWAPNKWIALIGTDGVALKGSNGKDLVVPAYELP